MRFVATIVLAFGVLGACGGVPEGVPVETEPRHRLVSERDFAQVLDVQILGGDTTMFHRHSLPMAYVCVRGSETATQATGEDWNPPGTPCAQGFSFSTPQYRETPLTHRVANVGIDLFHLVGVQNLRAPAERTALGLPGAGATVVDNAWFRTQSIELGGGERTLEHTHEVPTLIVLAAGAGVESISSDGRVDLLVEEGAWLWLDSGAHTLTSADGLDVRLVEVEVK